MITADASVASGHATVRRATSADNAARCELFARVSMETDVGLSVRRDPDFDALYRLQTRDWLSVVVELDGAVEGTGTLLVRDGYVGGEVRRVGYLGDLRFSRRVQGRLLLDRAYAGLLEEARDRLECEVFLTSIIASNARALRSLVTQTARSRAARRPVYTPIGDFDIRSLHLLLPRRRAQGGVHIRRATDGDVPAIARLLDADARRRPFGYVMTEAELRRRLREWPGLDIGAFQVAESRAGELVGCCALWDAAPVKRMVVTAYRGAMTRVRLAYDATALLLRRSRLPRPGEPFRYQYITHQAVARDDPRILRALLEHAYTEARGARYHFLSACVPERSPLAPAFHGFHATSLRATLFVVSLPGIDVKRIAQCGIWPGFEMALV